MASRSGQNFEDLYSAAQTEVALRMHRYDPAKFADFGAWARQVAIWGMRSDMRKRDSVRKCDRARGVKGSNMCSLDSYPVDQAEFLLGSTPFCDTIAEAERLDGLRAAVGKLKPMHAEIIKLLFWHDVPTWEIGVKYGLCRARICQIIANDIVPTLRRELTRTLAA